MPGTYIVGIGFILNCIWYIITHVQFQIKEKKTKDTIFIEWDRFTYEIDDEH